MSACSRLEDGGIQRWCSGKYHLKPFKIIDDKAIPKDKKLREAFEMAKSGCFYLVKGGISP